MTNTITIGVVGSGDVPPLTAVKQLEDVIDASGAQAHFVFAVDASWNATYDGLIEWASEAGIAYDVVHDQDAAKDRNLREVIEGARRATQVLQVARKVVDEVEKAPGNKLVAVLWNPETDNAEDEEIVIASPGYAAVELASDRGVDCYDLLEWDKLNLGDDTDPAPTEAIAATPPAPVEVAVASTDEEPVVDAEGGEEVPTLEELQAMSLRELKALASKEGVEVPKGSHHKTYVTTLDAFYEALANGEEPQGEVIPELREALVQPSILEQPAPSGNTGTYNAGPATTTVINTPVAPTFQLDVPELTATLADATAASTSAAVAPLGDLIARQSDGLKALSEALETLSSTQDKNNQALGSILTRLTTLAQAQVGVVERLTAIEDRLSPPEAQAEAEAEVAPPAQPRRIVRRR